MNTIMEEKYIGDGGVAQRNFIKDAQVGWKAIVNDPQKHLGGGVCGRHCDVHSTLPFTQRTQTQTQNSAQLRCA